MPNFLFKEPAKIPDFISKPLEMNKSTIDTSITTPKTSSDYLNISTSIQKPSITPPISPFNISTAALQPPATAQKQNSSLLLTSMLLPQQTNTIIAPPIPVALSQPPPLSNSSFPGPPTLASALPPSQVQSPTLNGSAAKQPANPYSARGALNKKVYETQITSVPVQAVNLPPPLQELRTPPTNNIYVPPQPSATPTQEQQPQVQQITTNFTPSYSTQSSYSSPPPTSTYLPAHQQPDTNHYNM